MPTDTEKLSDAELLIANARARTRALKYEYLTAEEQLWRDLAAYLEKALTDLTARNDTVARGLAEIDTWEATPYPWRECLVRLRKALTPTQPEAAVVPNVYDEIRTERHRQDELWGGPAHDDSHDWWAWADYINERTAKLKADEEPARPRQRELYLHIAALAVAAIETYDREQPPTAPPETRDAARERLAWLIIEAMPHGYRGPFRNWVPIKKNHSATFVCERCSYLAEARAAAAGGKRNE